MSRSWVPYDSRIANPIPSHIPPKAPLKFADTSILWVAVAAHKWGANVQLPTIAYHDKICLVSWGDDTLHSVCSIPRLYFCSSDDEVAAFVCSLFQRTSRSLVLVPSHVLGCDSYVHTSPPPFVSKLWFCVPLWLIEWVRLSVASLKRDDTCDHRLPRRWLRVKTSY